VSQEEEAVGKVMLSQQATQGGLLERGTWGKK
jgi:hypothetical protein